MKISILLPTYNRPGQLKEALDSVAIQDHSLIHEVLIGDNSNPEMLAANAEVVAASPIAHLIEHTPNVPPVGGTVNQWNLVRRAGAEHVLVLHDDDHLAPDGLRKLADACEGETDPRVEVWFGRNYIMDETSVIDLERSAKNDEAYGKDGPGATQPLWQWCLTQSLPPNSALMRRDVYVRYMQGPRDGNVSDWGLWVRLSNTGAWGRFIPYYVSSYRVQMASQTSSGRGMDAHLWYELGTQLQVPPEEARRKAEMLRQVSVVATMRYLRDGERKRAWECFTSSNWSWRQRMSARGIATELLMLTPRRFWLWALHHRA